MSTDNASKETKPQKTQQPKRSAASDLSTETEYPVLSDRSPENILRLQRMIGNAETSKLLRSQSETAPALVTSSTTRTIQRAPPEGTPPAPVEAKAEVKPAHTLDEYTTLIIAQFQTLYERQRESVDRLTTDLAKADDPSIQDQIIKGAVQAALGQALSQLGVLIGNAAGNAVSNVMLKQALKKAASGPQIMGITDEELAQWNTEGARATAMSVATSAGTWVGDKMKAKVPEVYASISSTASVRQKFLEAHRLTLINDKAIHNEVFMNQVRPEFQKLPENEGAIAAQRYLEGLKAIDAQAIDIQYLSSVAQWAEVLRGGDGSGGPFQLSEGNQGVLTIQFSAPSPGGTVSIVGASMSGIQKSIIDRIKTTDSLKARTLNELPMAKMYRMENPAVQIQIPPGASTVMDASRDIAIGGGWLAKRADALNNTTGSTEFGGAISLGMEIGGKTLGSLGDIKQG